MLQAIAAAIVGFSNAIALANDNVFVSADFVKLFVNPKSREKNEKLTSIAHPWHNRRYSGSRRGRGSESASRKTISSDMGHGVFNFICFLFETAKMFANQSNWVWVSWDKIKLEMS